MAHPLWAPFPSPVPALHFSDQGSLVQGSNPDKYKQFLSDMQLCEAETNVIANTKEVATTYICAQKRKALSLDWVCCDVTSKAKRRATAPCLCFLWETQLGFAIEQVTIWQHVCQSTTNLYQLFWFYNWIAVVNLNK